MQNYVQNQSKSYWPGRTKTSEIFVGKKGSHIAMQHFENKTGNDWLGDAIYFLFLLHYNSCWGPVIFRDAGM